MAPKRKLTSSKDKGKKLRSGESSLEQPRELINFQHQVGAPFPIYTQEEMQRYVLVKGRDIHKCRCWGKI